MSEPPRILIVDDTPQNIELLEAILAPRGYAVLAAGGGAAALGMARTEAPDLVLLDVVMPEMDGYEVCRRLRDDPGTRALPVILITASGDRQKIEALDAGADDFIQKPFDRTELLARVRSLLRIKQYQDTVEAQAAELADWNATLAARVEERTGELAEARAELLTVYRELAERNQQLHGVIERLLGERETPDRRSHRSSATVERLTPRELDVLRLVARGQTNGEIADRLVVSVGTVKSHLENIIAKLGVADRTQAAVRAIEQGLLAPADP